MAMDIRPMGSFRRFETAEKVDLGARVRRPEVRLASAHSQPAHELLHDT